MAASEYAAGISAPSAVVSIRAAPMQSLQQRQQQQQQQQQPQQQQQQLFLLADASADLSVSPAELQARIRALTALVAELRATVASQQSIIVQHKGEAIRSW